MWSCIVGMSRIVLKLLASHFEVVSFVLGHEREIKIVQFATMQCSCSSDVIRVLRDAHVNICHTMYVFTYKLNVS